jgi:flagellin
MATVNTNVGAMVALQNLNKTNSELATVQKRINTGMIVSSAKDNGALFAIAQGMRADVASYNAVDQSLNRGVSTVDVAIAAGEAVSDLLVEMKELALGAADTSLDATARSALNTDYQALATQINTVVTNAAFNGINLLDNSTTGISALANEDATATITVADEDFSAGGAVLGTIGALTTAAAGATEVGVIDTAIGNANAALARLGTGSKSFEIQSTFVGKLSDALTAGIGNLVDADLAAESAKLQALQVKQQLGVQALSIANSAPSMVLGLFR